MVSEIEFQNTITKYIVGQKDVPYVGELKAVVEIAAKPIFDNNTSIDVLFLSNNNTLGSSSISYISINAEEYRGRINLSIILPHECLRDSTLPYKSSRDSVKKFLPKIIAEYEKNNSK